MRLGKARSPFVKLIVLSFLLVPLATAAAAEESDSQKPQDWEQRLEMLRSMPYLGYSLATAEEGDTGVVFFDHQQACQGYNFYCTRSGGKVLLLDMNGRLVHRWNYRPSRDDYAIMLDNGDLVVVVRHAALLRLNWDSEVIWKRKQAAHHDVVQASDGSLYTIVRESKDHRGMRVWFDAVLHLTTAGEEIDRWSTHEHLDEIKNLFDRRSFLDTVLDSAMAQHLEQDGSWQNIKEKIARHYDFYDYFHLNTVSLLPATELGEKDARFQQGNLLICLRNVNQIAVLEKDTYRVLWAWGEGQLQWPHHSTMLDNGHMLIFDNGIHRKYSRVVELDPVTGDIVWEYTANTPEDFYSYFRGSAQRLPNGNTLICESDNGRVFEVTVEGDVVWTWLHPEMRGGHRKSLYRVYRLPPEKVHRLLEE